MSFFRQDVMSYHECTPLQATNLSAQYLLCKYSNELRLNLPRTFFQSCIQSLQIQVFRKLHQMAQSKAPVALHPINFK